MTNVISPGNPATYAPATGLLVRGIEINGNYLIVDSCSVFPVQKMQHKWFMQGGPRQAIADIGLRYIAGQITCPIRVDRDGNMEDAIVAILKNAENPGLLDNTRTIKFPLKIATNHVLSQIEGITAKYGGTDNNKLVSLDSCLVENLTLSANDSDGVKLTFSVIGIIDENRTNEYVAPPSNYLLHRQLSFGDCNASRIHSAMRAVTDLEIKVENTIEQIKFLLALDEEPYDQPKFLGVSESKWSGNFNEVLRKGADTETFIHGGFMVGENLILKFGPITASITVPLFGIGEQPLIAGLLTRKTEFKAQVAPEMTEGKLFLFN